MKITQPGTVILTYGRSLMTVVAARSLASRGVEVISCDSVGMTAAKFSRYTSGNFIHADPDEDEEQYFADLLAHIETHKPADGRPYVLMPMFRDARLISENRDRFEGRITLAVPPFEAINQVDPKHHLVKTLAGLDIAAPKTWYTETQDELEKALFRIQMPAIVKAVDEVGGRGIEFFEDREAFTECARRRFKSETPPPLLQETAKGEDYCLCVLYQNGERLAHMAYTNLQTMPTDGGSGAMRETIDDRPFLKASDDIMKATNWSGVAEIDFMWTGDPKDTPLMIEINPRFWAGLFQSVESGIDFPWLNYQLAASGTVETVPDADVGTKTKIPGAWLAGGLSEAFAAREEHDGMNWSEMFADAKEGDFAGAWGRVKTAFKDATDFDSAIALIKQQSRAAKEAKSELMLDDDPAISLGIFYILSSLARHGELPDELK